MERLQDQRPGEPEFAVPFTVREIARILAGQAILTDDRANSWWMFRGTNNRRFLVPGAPGKRRPERLTEAGEARDPGRKDDNERKERRRRRKRERKRSRRRWWTRLMHNSCGCLPMYIFVFKYLNTSFAAIPRERARKIFRRLFTVALRAAGTRDLSVSAAPCPLSPTVPAHPPVKEDFIRSRDISSSYSALLRSFCRT